MVSGIGGSDGGTLITTSGLKVDEIIWSSLSSVSAVRVFLEIGVSEEHWTTGSGNRDEPSGSAEVISSHETDVKDDEENHENPSDRDAKIAKL